MFASGKWEILKQDAIFPNGGIKFYNKMGMLFWNHVGMWSEISVQISIQRLLLGEALPLIFTIERLSCFGEDRWRTFVHDWL